MGGDLPTLIGADLAQETIDYADQIYLEFGADEHIEGLGHEEERKEIRRRAIQAGLKLVDCPIRHMGTEKAQAFTSPSSGTYRRTGWRCTSAMSAAT